MYGGYHCAVNRVSIRRLWMLWVPHVSGLHVGSSVGAHAQESETLLRPRRSALRDLQLLPKAAVAENDSRAKLVCARAASDSRTVQVFAGGLCGYARSRTFASKRAAEVDAIADVEGAQTAGFPRFAQEKTQSR